MKNYVTRNWTPLSLSPLFFATAFCGAGILSCQGSLSPVYTTLGIFCFCILILFFKKHNRGLIIGISIGAFVSGFVRYDRLVVSYLRTYEQLPNKPFDVYAKVIDLEIKRGNRFASTLTVAVSSLIQEGIIIPSNARLVINLIQAPPLYVGDTIALQGISHKPLRSTSFQRYLQKEGLTTSLYLPCLRYTLHKRPRFSIARGLHTYRSHITQKSSLALSPSCYTLFSTLFLGMKQSHTKSYKELQKHCCYWGILHYLSRSGLHALLITYVLATFLRLFPLPFFLKETILVLCMVIYYCLTWPSIAFTRAFITLLLYKMFTMGGTSYKTLHILSLITLVTLLVNPFQLFSLDFQLSFGLTWTLAWFNEVKLVAKRITSS
ncbi:ComEC/Rec2 family competence protein [Candidatus Dependentiae bacterium]|nr:ComEC/Rec2 family competence protein [Candidatus Dependentiae bacterium]